MTPLWRAALGSVATGLAVALVGTVAGLGLPGALVAALAMPLIAAFWPAEDPFPADSGGPFVILLTLLLGALVPVLWLATRAMRLRGWRRAIVVALGLPLGGIVLAVLLYAVTVAPLLAR